MMKIIGIAIVAISTIMFSFMLFEKYKIRPNSLQMYIELIECYYTHLKWHKKSFCETFKNYKTEDKYLITAKSLLINNCLIDAFVTNNDLFLSLYLTKEDQLIIENFLRNCGKQNYATELNLCEKTLASLSKQKQAAAIKYKDSGSLCLKLGGIAALWIFVLLV